MIDGRITRHYGFGAARIGLCPEPFLPDREESVRDALARALRESRRGGLLRDAASLAPAAAIGLILLAACLVLFASTWRDEPDVDLVLMASPPEPAPQPEPALEPPPVPEPRPRLAEPPPPPQVEQPPPPPPAVARPAPQPVPARQPPAPARPPASAPRPAPRTAPRPAPPARPRAPVAVPALAAAPQAPPPQPVQRSRPLPAPVSRPELPPPGLSAPAQAPPAFDVARAPARSGRRSPPLPAVTPAPAPVLAPAAAPAFAAPRASAQPARQRRPRPATAAQTARPNLGLPGAQPAAPSRRPAPVRLARAEAPARAASTPRTGEPALAGVPLGSLASCVSDRKEDALKQRVIAAVHAPAECTSPAGRYRFLETKNLNAFLMWVERSASRQEADRCVELALALECLDQRRARGGRK